jgi:glycosyltransferase Alg8
LFGAYPSLRALTTDEDAKCLGPAWMQKWLIMRFAQRRMWMQSHSLSRRVLTLTGRFSMFRATDIVQEEFIHMVEADHLDHWFWGSFRFLSGDDKSTWYCLLKQRAEMIYVPDAMVYTIEYVEGKAFKRACDNVLRWSGNMLRNGMRAIVLGPRIVPPFIWWCLIDQRLTIWTTLAGFFTAMSVAHFINPSFIFTYFLWIAATRFLMSSTLFLYSNRIHMSYPLILYCNQLLLAFVKAYMIFRLPQQRWANRLDQRSGDDLVKSGTNRYFAGYLNTFYMVLLLFGVLLMSGVLYVPAMAQIF